MLLVEGISMFLYIVKQGLIFLWLNVYECTSRGFFVRLSKACRDPVEVKVGLDEFNSL